MKLEQLVAEYEHNYKLLFEAWEANDPAHKKYAKHEDYLEKKINNIKKQLGTYSWNPCKYTSGVSCMDCTEDKCIVKTHGALSEEIRRPE